MTINVQSDITDPTTRAPASPTQITSILAGLGLTIGSNVQAWSSVLDAWALKAVPAGTPVGTTDTQTLSNKTLTAPILGTPASATLTNATGLPLTTGVTGLLPIANGGTATATPALVAGTNITITGSWPNQTINSTGGGGNVATDNIWTAVGDLAVGTGVHTAARVAIGTALQVLQVNSGATGLQWATLGGGGNALTANPLSQFAATTSAQLAGVMSDETGSGALVFATSPTLVTPALGTPASGVLTNTTGLPISTGVAGLASGAATFLATPTSANLAAMLTDETGTGANVFATSPTLVTPSLGTPSALVMTNATGFPGALGQVQGLTPSNDDVLQRKAGAWTNRTIAQLAADLLAVAPSINTQSGTTYTLSASDNNTTIRFTSASPVTVTVPTAFSGFTCNIENAGTSTTTLATSSTTLNGHTGVLNAQYLAVQLIPAGANTWDVLGADGAVDGPAVSVASATTTDVFNTSSSNVSVTGTTTITGLGTAAAGNRREVTFTGALILTNSAALPLPGAANITTAAGDRMGVTSLGSGNAAIRYYTKADGTPVVGGGGSGTVTHTGGSLTSNALVLGAGTADTKVVTGITTDGTSAVNLGVAGTSVGKVVLSNATSGTITVQPVTGALGAVTWSIPAATDTAVGKATTDTLTNKTLTAPAITGGTATALTGLAIRSTGAAFDLTLASSEVLTAGRTLSVVMGDAARTLTLFGSTTVPVATQNLTFAGPTAARTITFPDAAITVARSDAAQTFTGTQTFGAVVLNGTASGTGVAAAATASTLALRDANGNVSANATLDGYTTTATAAGTTTLTVSSTQLQYFTGSTTQTVALPVTSTLVLGQRFNVKNLSTGSVTVQSSGANTVATVAANTQATFTCILTSGTTAASWDSTTSGAAAGTGTVTNTGGNLTANSVVLGAGTVDTKVVAGIVSDGTSKFTLGVAGTSVGAVAFNNATSGSVTLQPVTGALGAVTLSLPAATDTLVGKATTDTLTNKSIDAGQLTGTVSVNRFNSGTSASSSTFLRGDGTWATPAGSGTVTATGGSLTANSLVIGAGTTDTKIIAGLTADTNGNLFANAFIPAFATTATAAGTTTLTVSSKQYQDFTGSTTQTVKLPDTSTLVVGWQYTIRNRSTGSVAVQASDASSVISLLGLEQRTFTCVSVGVTTNAAWDAGTSKINGLAISATNATLTVSSGKSATISNSLVIAGTDSTTLTFQGTDTYVGRATTDTLTNKTLTAPTINGGTATALTGLAIRSTGAAFDLTLASSEVLTAGRTLSVVMGDAARTLTLFGSTTVPVASQQLTFSGPTAARTITLPDAAITVARTDAAQTFTGTQTFGAVVGTTWNGNTWATGTGTLSIAAGKTLTASNSITFAGTDATTMTFPGASASVGYLGLPQNSNSANYTTVLADAGKHIFHPAADTTARTFTIDSNANVAYPVGTTLTFVNQNAGGVITIAITTDTMRLAGAGTTGSRTLAANGIATALKVTSTEWLCNGTGLT